MYVVYVITRAHKEIDITTKYTELSEVEVANERV